MTVSVQAKTMATENAPQDEAEREPAQKATLVNEYRKVGPAAINAALLCCPKAKKDSPKRSYEPRDEI